MTGSWDVKSVKMFFCSKGTSTGGSVFSHAIPQLILSTGNFFYIMCPNVTNLLLEFTNFTQSVIEAFQTYDKSYVEKEW